MRELRGSPSAPAGERSREAYATLDGLRGVAALVVVFFHFGANIFAPHGYLAVDLFFVMSGFVIASAYERRLLGDLGAGGFFGIRIRRLGPLLAAGAVIGVACATVGGADAHNLLGLGLLSLILIPTSGAFLRAFPLNGSLWSLHVEVVVNLAYAWLIQRLTSPRLLLVAGASFAALTALALAQGSISDGGSQLDMLCGYLRALVAFPVGVLIWRWRGRLAAWRVGAPALFAVAAIALVGYGVPTRGLISVIYDLGFLALGAPALVVLAAANEPSAALRPLCRAAGSASYALYALHEPIIQAARRVASAHGGVPVYLAIGAVLLPGLIVLAWAADRFFDAPVRRWLGKAGGLVSHPLGAGASNS